MSNQLSFEIILDEIRNSPLKGRGLRNLAVSHLIALHGYDWAGIYALNGDILELDAYEGADTDHTRIPIGQGVCGTAIAENKNQVIEDVRKLDNYLACSLETRSEIVVLIRGKHQILGQIDIDGHKTGAFGSADEAFLKELASIIGERWNA